MAGENAKVRLGLSNEDFINGLRAAEQRAKGFESQVAGLFRRSPLHRAERAFSDFAANLATGNVGQAITGFAERLTGLGLLAGVGVGAAVVIFQKFKGQIDATKKSTEALFAELSKPLPAQAALGPEGISAQIASLDKAITDVATKRQTLGSKIGELFEQTQVVPVPSEIPGAPDTFELQTVKQTRAQEALQSGQERIHALRQADVEAEKALVDVHALSLQFSEKEAALEKNRLDASQKIAALRLKYGRDPREAANLAREVQNIRRDEQLSATEIERKAELKDRELDIDQEIAAEALRGVSTEDQKVSRLKQELKLIQDQLHGSTALTSENEKQLRVSEAKTQAELAAARAAASGRPVLSQQDIQERTKLSIQDIASSYSGQRAPIDLEGAIRAGNEARMYGGPQAIAKQALRDEELSRLAALHGDQGLAQMLFGMSDKLREGIPGLKSAEKPISIADALQQYGKGPEIVTELQELKGRMDQYWGQ
jgi:hypothetical protein